MQKDIYEPIAPTSEEVIAAIRHKTALSLPDDPAAASMKAATIKRRFWEAICGGDASLLSELRRIVGEVNAAIDAVIEGYNAAEGEREKVTRRAEAAADRVAEGLHGDRVYVRYSAYPDGRGYVSEWARGLNYIGIAVGLEEPTDASGYEWQLMSPGVYVGSGEMPDYADIQIDPDGAYWDDPLTTRVNEIDDKVNVCESKISRNDKRIANLERGFKADSFVTDASVAYTKDVPVNALPWAELAKVGGMSYEEGGVLKSAPVTGIEVVGANLTTAQAVYEGADKYLETVMDDRNCVRFTSGFRLKKTPIAFKPNTQYTVSFYAKGEDVSGAAATNNGFTFYYEDGTNTSINVRANSPWTLFTLTSQSGKTVKEIGIEANEYRAYVYLDTDTFMLNKGNTALPYAPYTERTTTIPEAVQSIDGYGRGISGLVYNYVDFEKKQFVKRVEKLILNGTEAWNYYPEFSRFALVIAKNAALYTEKCLCDKYEHNPNVYRDADREMGIVAHKDRIFVRDANYTSDSAWKTQLASNPVTIYFELAEPIITDISDILPDDNYIEVEGGGTVTMVNEHQLAVPSEITYQIKEVTA